MNVLDPDEKLPGTNMTPPEFGLVYVFVWASKTSLPQNQKMYTKLHRNVRTKPSFPGRSIRIVSLLCGLKLSYAPITYA